MRVPRWARNWFLDGWGRLLAIGAMLGSVFVVVVIVVHLTSASPPPRAVPRAIRATVHTAPASTTTTTVAPTTTTTAPPLPPRQSLPAAAARAATTFIDTWSDRSLPPAVWHRRIAALVTTAEQPGFAATDYPAAVPAAMRIVGAPIGSGDRGGASVQVLTTKFDGSLMLAVMDGRWLVTYFDT